MSCTSPFTRRNAHLSIDSQCKVPTTDSDAELDMDSASKSDFIPRPNHLNGKKSDKSQTAETGIEMGLIRVKTAVNSAATVKKRRLKSMWKGADFRSGFCAAFP